MVLIRCDDELMKHMMGSGSAISAAGLRLTIASGAEQFPNPGHEGLDLSRGLPGGTEPRIIEVQLYQQLERFSIECRK